MCLEPACCSLTDIMLDYLLGLGINEVHVLGLQVWLLKPVALEDQARELLRACNYDQALRLAELCASEGAAWAEVAFAEAAFMLMQGLHALPLPFLPVCMHACMHACREAIYMAP